VKDFILINFGRVKKKIWPWKNYVELYFMEKHYDLMIKNGGIASFLK
jgi:hypothetical protein